MNISKYKLYIARKKLCADSQTNPQGLYFPVRTHDQCNNYHQKHTLQVHIILQGFYLVSMYKCNHQISTRTTQCYIIIVLYQCYIFPSGLQQTLIRVVVFVLIDSQIQPIYYISALIIQYVFPVLFRVWQLSHHVFEQTRGDLNYCGIWLFSQVQCISWMNNFWIHLILSNVIELKHRIQFIVQSGSIIVKLIKFGLNWEQVDQPE
eukprot:TRINITY_DN3323_c0_g1_i5.p3 TRINITY_DN3323_c0_g1~~TRINITY_DN3323_c0_g1_i5.p3  ORF type:complete len:206 (+),score=-16.42 TRINITY_DN3323_c0_g1_i5:1192-1809(+)